MTISNKLTNTLIITDRELLHPENRSILQTTIKALEDFIRSLNKLQGLKSCLQIIHLKSLGRILLIFSESHYSEIIYRYLHDLKIKVDFARNDSVISKCDLDSECKGPSSHVQTIDVKLNVNDDSKEPINERYPGTFPFSKLEPPNPPIQMQSPPPSPYEGWVNQPEEAPSETTIGYHPKKLSHILYTVDPDTNERKRVFSSFIDSEQPEEKYTNEDELQDLDIGEALHEEESVGDNNVLLGSLFQSPKLPLKKTEKITGKVKFDMKVPIVVIDSDEAINLQKQAKNFEN